jgi:membrane-associated protease RseP (regulator of RpoE activity)
MGLWYPCGMSGTEAIDPDVYFPEAALSRYRLPLILFALTAVSTFWVGITDWQPLFELGRLRNGDVPGGWDWMHLRQLFIRNWEQGIIYSAAALAILLAHEMGHFVATLIHRVHATPPFFLPFPFSAIGTLGAVIALDRTGADRKQTFDIGIAGPIAGLVIAIPMAFYGASQLDLNMPPAGPVALEMPLGLHWIMQWSGVPGLENVVDRGLWLNQVNPWLVAAWVGFVVTGLNMIPVGQLDGGHIVYCLFGRFSWRISELMIVIGVAFMVWRGMPHLAIMVLLLLLMGTRHPATRNDQIPLGSFRTALGWISLVIPFLCFPPRLLLLAE